MISMNRYFVEQLKIHPSMQPQDVVKLCYQAAFGAEHLLADLDNARQYLFEEYASTEPVDLPVYEHISEHYCRVNLAGWKYHGLPIELLWEIFAESAARCGERQDFRKLMNEYLDTAEAVLGSEKTAELTDYLEDYFNQGIRPVHHSEQYRKAENPHYRVVLRELLPQDIGTLIEKRG
jgi:hypothetical protein